MPKLKLHTKIILGLLLGAVFGSIFSINPHKLEITSNNQKQIIEDWSEFTLAKGDSVIKTFDNNSQLAIIKYFKGIKNKDYVKAKVKFPGS